MKKVYEFLGGRKLLFAIILFLVISAFVLIGKATTDQWMDFNKWIFGIYASGNGLEHIAKAIKK